MAGTEFEFRYRFWLITAIYTAAFYCYRIDRTNAAAALAFVLTGTRGPWPDSGTRLVLGCGAALAAAGAWLRSWAAAYLRSAVVHDSDLHADRIVADGPFRHLRNPLYLGMYLIALGICLAMSRLGCAVLAIAVAWFGFRLILREERILAAAQSESYHRYRNRVPRIFPSIRPLVPPSGAKANRADGILGEGLSWSLAAGVGALAVTGRPSSFYVALAIGFILYFLHRFLTWQHLSA